MWARVSYKGGSGSCAREHGCAKAGRRAGDAGGRRRAWASACTACAGGMRSEPGYTQLGIACSFRRRSGRAARLRGQGNTGGLGLGLGPCVAGRDFASTGQGMEARRAVGFDGEHAIDEDDVNVGLSLRWEEQRWMTVTARPRPEATPSRCIRRRYHPSTESATAGRPRPGDSHRRPGAPRSGTAGSTLTGADARRGARDPQDWRQCAPCAGPCSSESIRDLAREGDQAAHLPPGARGCANRRQSRPQSR